MVDLLITGVLAAMAALGGIFIRDLKALLIFTMLISTAAFLISILTNIPTVVLGLVGLLTAAVKLKLKISPREATIKTYKSLKRLRALEELVEKLPQEIIDVIPAGSRRVIHPNLLQLVDLVARAYNKGYAVEEPEWFIQLRQYLSYVGPNFSPEKTKVVSTYEVVDLDV